ncbi:polysaccharide biosynthesis/export family protein [Celeribacter marinus]|uniref:polysaccharide biosynthesis/export family protein n=1 Tax=Celeribacter marinus TaxID=1397108 RepID=UPI00316E5D87
MPRLISGLLAVFLVLFASAGHAAGYRIQAGDTLKVEVLEDPLLNRTVLVLPDGSVNFPSLGAVRARGKTAIAVQDEISKGLGVVFASTPTVYVSVVHVRDVLPSSVRPDPDNIYVMGEVKQPGLIKSEKPISVLQAIAQAGGFTRFAATKRVELHRIDTTSQSEQVYYFDYKNKRGISGGFRLRAGDVISVPERKLFE